MDFIKDADCTKETPVRLGVPDAPIYGKGIKLKPRVDVELIQSISRKSICRNFYHLKNMI